MVFFGQRHRKNGPALITNNKQEWWFKGQLHREDGPAYIDEEVKMWLVEGKLHRLDGPAVLYNDGRQKWYQNGLLHREDGPAVINSPVDYEYWLAGEKVTQREINRTQMEDVLEKIQNVKQGLKNWLNHFLS